MILDRARAESGAFGALRLWICGFAGLTAALAGCSTNTKVYNGTPVVTVTAQSTADFSSYTVGISVYSMTRSDGYVAYPAGYTYEEFADLTQRVDLTELLNAVGVPDGTYKSVVIGIDYSEPLVYLNGQTTQATVEDSSGNVDPGIIYVTVTLDPSHQLVVSQNQSTPLALDFDLAASNTVNATTNTVVVRPFVEAVTPSNDTQPVRARGLFVVASPSQGTFVEDLRPFEDNIYATVGALTVNTTANTYYNIDGVAYIGPAGLSALQSIASNTPVIAIGSLNGTPPGSSSTITPALTATQVYAGTVVSNGVYEHVEGIVTAISGDTLTVADATYLYYEGYCISNLCFEYVPTASINIGPSTLVTEDNVAPPNGGQFGAQSITVGSQVDAIGVNANPSASTLTLDSTSGLVRLQSTPIWGTLTSGTAGSATLDLASMGDANVSPSAFNFAGTGTASANDATAASYTVDTSAASATAPSSGPDQSATAAGTLLRIDGFPAPYGSAPPDFNATDVIPATSAPSTLVVEWGGGTGTTTPFTSYDSTALALNLTGASVATVVTGPQCTFAVGCAAGAALTGTPAITISGATQFAIGNSTNGVSIFSAASAFASDLSTVLNGSTSIYRVVAIGSYDSASNTFAASRIDVALD